VICVAELSRAGAGSVHGHAGYAAAGFGMVPVRLAEVAVDEPAVREAWVGSRSVWNLALWVWCGTFWQGMPYFAIVRRYVAGQETVTKQSPNPRGASVPRSGRLYVSAPSRGLRAEAMICWATWSPRPGRELEAKPALSNSLKRVSACFT